MDASFDDALRDEYVAFDIPSDQVVANPEAARAFVERVQERLGRDVDGAGVLHRLLTLRKLGELPRLRRSAPSRFSSAKT